MVTDVYFAEQTALDPFSDVIQIIGRFRNGVTSIEHITNVNYDLPQRSEEELCSFMDTSENVYETLRKFYDAAPNKGAREAYRLQWKVCRLIGCLIGTDIRTGSPLIIM